MRNKNLILNIALIISAIAGMVVSAVLIFEYFGITPAVAEAVCSKGHTEVNACTVVSASRFAAIRGIPFIGDIPVAAAGFAFYGLILIIEVMNLLRKSRERIRPSMILIAVLSGTALAGDIVLYLISVFIIKFVCPLCVITYISTLIILFSSLLIIRNIKFINPEVSPMRMNNYFKVETRRFIIIALVLGLVTIGLGTGARLIAENKETSTYADRLERAVRQYETAETVKISRDNVPFIGKNEAPAQFIVFFDYTCSHCMNEISTLEKLMKKYPGAVSVYFKFLPIDGYCGSLEKKRDDPSSGACIASAAAYSVYKQNRFMEYSKLLFDGYHNKGMRFTEKTVRELAKSLKLNMDGFEKSFSSDTAEKFIKSQYLESEKLGIGSTPTVYLNGKMLTAGLSRPDILDGLVRYCIKRGR